MGIRLTEKGYFDLREHIGHKIECVCYGQVDLLIGNGTLGTDPINIALECVDCGCVLVDFNHPDLEESLKQHPVAEEEEEE